MPRPSVPFAAFLALPLIKVFYEVPVDTPEGLLYRFEVRRCPATGLTLTARRPDTPVQLEDN